MAGIQLVIALAERDRGDKCMSALREYGGKLVLNSAGVGTATGDMLRLLAISRTEKSVVFALCSEHTVMDAMAAAVVRSLALVFSVSLDSISAPLFQQEPAGASKREGVSSMNEAKYEVIVAMANRGCIDLVMNAARQAGATGGTVIHARGTGSEGGEQFFGISLADERDIFFIVTPAADRNAIMQAIIRDAGLNSPAKAAVFSIPIQHIAGFPKFEVL